MKSPFSFQWYFWVTKNDWSLDQNQKKQKDTFPFFTLNHLCFVFDFRFIVVVFIITWIFHDILRLKLN